MKHEITIPAAGGVVCGELRMADRPAGMVVLAHGSGTTRHDPTNRYVAASLVRDGFAVLLVDLLQDWEAHDRYHVFDVKTQADRLLDVTRWLRAQPATRSLDIGYYGTGVGSAVVVTAAATAPPGVGALVARGGRPDIAGPCLPRLKVPALFIAAEHGADRVWVEAAYLDAAAPKELVRIPCGDESFGEPAAAAAVARHACRWFSRHLASSLEPRIHELQSQLRQRYPGSDCHVTVEDRVPHDYERRRFNVRVDVSLGGRSFVVNRENDEDPGMALREAFSCARGQLDALEAAGHRP